jgi:hypothetical protein
VWSKLSGENLKETKEVQEAVLIFFRTPVGMKFFQLLMSDYFHWKGPIMNDEQVHLHNAGQRFLGFLYGRDQVEKEAFEGELRAILDVSLLDGGARIERQSGKSEPWHDSTGRQKRKKDAGRE